MLRQLFRVSLFTLVSQLLLDLLILLFATGFAIGVFAQERTWRAREGLPVGSESERYLRVLQLADKAPLYPWTLRGFTPSELIRVLPTNSEHPWHDRIDFTLEPPTNLNLGWIQPRVGLISNSAYPFGENDGAKWVGRGLTAVAEAGGFLRFGRLHFRLAPEVFWSENDHFALADNGQAGKKAAYFDETEPGAIDRPQRFGDGGYGRLGLGSSALHLELPGVTLGVSGAGQQWRPALHYPLLLGNNAGGFPHVFVQIGAPVDLWVAHLKGRYVFGSPKQSGFSPKFPMTEEHHRVVTGAILVLLPRGIDGLELGLARFIHSMVPRGGFQGRDLFRVFTAFADDQKNDREQNRVLENQMASLFFRWAFPRAGVEVYGELVKDDFVRDLRHIIEEPDDLMGRVFGFQKVWSKSEEHLIVLRGEMVNALVHHSERFDRLRTGVGVPLPLYYHPSTVFGHTQLGQILGSPTAFGGSGWTIGMDFYHSKGRWTFDLSRALQTEFSNIHEGTSGPEIADVIYALKLEGMRFYDGVEWAAAFTPSLNLNRNLIRENDVFNLTLQLSMTGLPW